VAVMGGQQAGMVLRIVAEQKQRSQGIEPDENVLKFLQESTAQQLDSQSTALYGTARLWDDGIIDPRDTRNVVAFALATCREAQQRTLQPISFGVPLLYFWSSHPCYLTPTNTRPWRAPRVTSSLTKSTPT